jgi:hypothetical protein
MSWENAPALNKLAASQLIGKNGAQIWGVDYRGRLYTNYQKTPGGDWDGWKTNIWQQGNHPKQVYELCASQVHGGEAQLWVLDMKRQLWTNQQNMQGDWSKWQGPGWNNLPNHVQLKKMAALWQSVQHGARFWGIAEDGKLISCSQHMPAGSWSPWQDWPETPSDLKKDPPVLPARWIEVTACNQGDGKGVLWALDTKMQLWSMAQESPGGKWGPWVGPNWGEKTPKLRNIAAVEARVNRRNENIKGACILGITDEYRLVYNVQSVPGGNWFGWSPLSFKDKLKGYEITAARQNNQSARVWAISNDQVLVSQQVNLDMSPPGFEWYWTPEWPPDPQESGE